MPVPVLRAAHPDEYALIGDMVVDVYRSIPGGHMSDDYAGWLRKVDERAAHGDVLVAEVDGRVVGTVTMLPGDSGIGEFDDPFAVEVRALAVVDDVRGFGIGGRLVRECLDRAWDDRRDRVWLYTTPWMTDAHRLYERLGFERWPEHDQQIRPEVLLLTYVLHLDRLRAALEARVDRPAGGALGQAMLGLGEVLHGHRTRQHQIAEHLVETANDGLDLDPDDPSASTFTLPAPAPAGDEAAGPADESG